MVNSVNNNQINPQVAFNNLHQNFNATVNTPENNFISGKVDDAKKSPLTSIGLFLVSWFTLSKVADFFNSKCKGEYKDTVYGKIGRFGDRVAETSVYKGIAGCLKRPLTGIKNYWNVNKESNVLLRCFNNPAHREWSFASRGPSVGYIDEICMDVIDVMRGFKNKHGEETFVKAFGQGYSEFEKMNAGAYTHAKELEQALKKAITYCKANGIEDTSILNDIPMLKSSFRLPRILSRNATLSESFNKMQMVKGLKNPMHNSVLGRLLPKWSSKLVEGMTNGTAGGKIIIAMQATMLADAIYRTYKAPWGEKKAAFMETMTNDVTMYMMLPIYTQVFDRIGGLKYIGMTTAQKKSFQSALALFNDTAAKKAFSKTEYKANKAAIKKLAKAGSKWYLKPLRWVGGIVNYGCERIYPYVPKGSGFTNFFKKTAYHLKGGVGIFRAIFALMFLAPLLSKPFVKVSHLIFGKPTNSILDEMSGEKDKKHQNNSKTDLLNKDNLFAPVSINAPMTFSEKDLGFTKEELALLKQKGLKDEEIVQIAAYKKMYEEDKKQKELLQEPKPLASNNLLDRPLEANSLKGVTQPSSTYRTYVPSSRNKVKPQENVSEHVVNALTYADRAIEDATDTLKNRI